LADREGNLERLKLQPGPYQTPRVSPDGKRVAFGIDDGPDSNIWVYDISRGGSPSRITFGGKNRFPVWSPKGDRIAFQSDREGDFGIFSQRVDGNGQTERLTTPEKDVMHIPESWGPIGDTLLFRVMRSAAGSNVTLSMLSMQDKKTSIFGGVESVNPTNAAFSPDGRWVAYHVFEPGKTIDEIYVQPFPATGAIYHVPTFAFGTPTSIKQVLQNYPPGSPRQYDVMPDGRLLGQVPDNSSTTGSPSQIHVVLNWFEELKQRVPAQ
jgi:Tol biopolymer transport system component